MIDVMMIAKSNTKFHAGQDIVISAEYSILGSKIKEYRKLYLI